MTEPVIVGLPGTTHPHGSARVRARQKVDGVQTGAAAEDARLEYFNDEYGLAPVATDGLLADKRPTAVMVPSKRKVMVPLALRVPEAGKALLVETPGGAALAHIRRLPDAEAPEQIRYTPRFRRSLPRARQLLEPERLTAITGEQVPSQAAPDLGTGRTSAWAPQCHVGARARVRLDGAHHRGGTHA